MSETRVGAAPPAISLVTPSWNGRHLLQCFLPSLVREAERWRGLGGEAEVVVADDGSTDDTLSWLAGHFPQVRVVAGGVNRGFASAANDAVLGARHEIVVLLNNDAELLPGALDALPKHFSRPECFGVTFRGLDLRGWDQPEIRAEAPTFAIGGKLGRFQRGFWSVWGNYDAAADERGPSLPTFFVSGGLCALRRSVFASLGGFDTTFSPYYWEDVDLSYRARKRGWRTEYEPAAQVLHATSATVVRHRTPFYRAAVTHRNRLLFHWMNLDGPGLARHLVWSHLLLLQMVWRGEWAYYAGWWQAWRRVGAVRRRRRMERRFWVMEDAELAVEAAPEQRTDR